MQGGAKPFSLFIRLSATNKSPTPSAISTNATGEHGMSNTVYKIVPAHEWRAACALGVYKGSPDDARDGFIHFSLADQIEGTAARHFVNQHGLLLVAFDADALGPDLRYEASRNGALFPHYYAELRTDLALWDRPMTVGEDGVPRVTGETI